MAVSRFPERAGEPPRTSQPVDGLQFFHQQLSQTAPVELQEELLARAATLDGVVIRHSEISVPGARGFFIDDATSAGPPEAFMVNREFAHLHPPTDGSMHLGLPPRTYDDVLAGGWGEPHPVVKTMMLFGPRDRDEFEIVWQVLRDSHRFALTGEQPS